MALMGERAQRVTVLGAGSWGTALADLTARAGHDVKLWALEPEVVEGINGHHQNPIYMRDVVLPRNLRATGDYSRALAGAEMVLLVIPAQLLRGQLPLISPHLPADAPLVICSKGIERGSLATMEQVLREELPPDCHGRIAVLSGPSFAAEVVKGMPTNVTVACRDLEVAGRVQATVATREFRIYTTDDVIGVEIGGALKNVIAIVVGCSDALITRGLSEITRIALKMGGRAETMLGLAGIGDLLLTCTGDLSRNRTVGKLLAKGNSMQQVKAQMHQVAEGVPTTESAHELASKHDIDAPIIEAVHGVIYRGMTVIEAMKFLQDRALKQEWQP